MTDVSCEPHMVSELSYWTVVAGKMSVRRWNFRALIKAPADGLMSAPSRMASEVMKRAAPTLVFRPTPRFTCTSRPLAVGVCPRMAIKAARGHGQGLAYLITPQVPRLDRRSRCGVARTSAFLDCYTLAGWQRRVGPQ